MPVAELNWRSMTATVNERKAPNQFLKRLAFPRHEPKPTENIEISVLKSARKIAPFVKRNGEALLVVGGSAEFFNVIPPNIRIKKPFEAADLLYTRRPGTTIFQTGSGGISQAIRAKIARDLAVMDDDVVNSEELLCAQMLTEGLISYTADGDAFTVDVQRPAGNSITSANLWTTPAAANLADDWKRAKRILSDEVGLPPSDVVLGLDAADAFTEVVTLGTQARAMLDFMRLAAGNVTFVTQFSEDGAIFLGNFQGTRVWEYSRTVDVNGTPTSLVPTKKAIFFHAGPAAQNVLYYGAIADMKTLQGRFMSERFSKSWETEDPSVLWALLASRPLPISRRPGSVVDMIVAA